MGLNDNSGGLDSEANAQELVQTLSFLRGGDGLKQNLEVAREIAETLDAATLQAALKQAIIAQTRMGIREGSLDLPLIIIREFQDSLGDVLQSPDVQKVAADAVYSYLKSGWIKSAIPFV